MDKLKKLFNKTENDDLNIDPKESIEDAVEETAETEEDYSELSYKERKNKEKAVKTRKRLKAGIIAFIAIVIVGGFIESGEATFKNFIEALTATPQSEQADDTIKIGIYESMSGEYSSYGNDEALGVELANKLVPEVLGKKVELVYADNKSNMDDAETSLDKLMALKPTAVIGSYGDLLTLVASDYMIASSTPAITPTATNPLITSNSEYYFSATFTLNKEGTALADYAVDAMKKETFSVISGNTDESTTTLVELFVDEIKKIKSEEALVGEYTVDVNSTDFNSTIDQLIAGKADTLLLAIPPASAITFMTQCEERGYTPLFLGGSDWDSDEMDKFLTKNPEFSASFPTVATFEGSEMYDNLVELYNKDRKSEDEVPSGNVAAGFDSYLLLMKAIENAYTATTEADLDALRQKETTDPAERALLQSYETTLETGIPTGTLIRDALKQINGFEGATGVISYSGGNAASKTVTIVHYFKGAKMDPYNVG